MKGETEHKQNGYNISVMGFEGLYDFIKSKYNTGEKVGIYENKENSYFLKMYYNDTINFELQRCGTITQQETYLNLKIRNLITNLKFQYHANRK
jgi:hypothetical protein